MRGNYHSFFCSVNKNRHLDLTECYKMFLFTVSGAAMDQVGSIFEGIENEQVDCRELLPVPPAYASHGATRLLYTD